MCLLTNVVVISSELTVVANYGCKVGACPLWESEEGHLY
jgi:hypothetical protein